MIITLFSIVQNTLFSAGTHVKSQGCVLEDGCVVGAGWRTGKKGEGLEGWTQIECGWRGGFACGNDCGKFFPRRRNTFA